MNEVNRTYWDAMAGVRGDGSDDYYDVDALIAGTRGLLRPEDTAALDAGLRIDALREHLESEVDARRDVLTREDDGLYRLRLGGTPVPVMFTLVAGKP